MSAGVVVHVHVPLGCGRQTSDVKRQTSLIPAPASPTMNP